MSLGGRNLFCLHMFAFLFTLLACWITLDSDPWCFYPADSIEHYIERNRGKFRFLCESVCSTLRNPGVKFPGVRGDGSETHRVDFPWKSYKIGMVIQSFIRIYNISILLESPLWMTNDDQWCMTIPSYSMFWPWCKWHQQLGRSGHGKGSHSIACHDQILTVAGRPCFFQFPGESQRNQRRNWRGLVYENWQ